MSYDLILQAKPDLINPDLRSRLNDQIAASCVLAKCELSMDDSDPVGDLEVLEEVFNSGETSRSEFLIFCRSRSLDATLDSTASLFLEMLWGRPLLVVFLQNDPSLVKSAFAELRRIATKLGIELYDPQAGASIDSSYSGIMPPNF